MKLSTDDTHVLQWCNGGHYFSFLDASCPESGYSNVFAKNHLRALLANRKTYAELISADIAETDLLRLLLVTDSTPPSDLISPCGAAAPLKTAELVCARNKVILEAFPSGHLWTALQPSEAPVLYAQQSPKDSWSLVDARYLHHWNMMYRLPEGPELALAILEHLSRSLSLDVTSMQRILHGEPVANVHVAELRVPKDHPPFLIDPVLHAAGEQEHAFVRERFPLLPPGHLDFLPLFYNYNS